MAMRAESDPVRRPAQWPRLVFAVVGVLIGTSVAGCATSDIAPATGPIGGGDRSGVSAVADTIPSDAALAALWPCTLIPQTMRARLHLIIKGEDSGVAFDPQTPHNCAQDGIEDPYLEVRVTIGHVSPVVTGAWRKSTYAPVKVPGVGPAVEENGNDHGVRFVNIFVGSDDPNGAITNYEGGASCDCSTAQAKALAEELSRFAAPAMLATAGRPPAGVLSCVACGE
jgi:hypothetical protein